MSSRFRPREDPGLFDDLPLHQDPARPEKPPASQQGELPERPGTSTATPERAPEARSLFDERQEKPVVEEVTRPAFRPIVPFRAFLTAGLIDLCAVLLVMLAVWAGLRAMGVDLDLVGWGLILVFLLPFSFLYQIFPLAFWGRTPGMARVGIIARSRDGQSLSFSQSAMRWVASILTVATLGLPLIVTAVTGTSLADRLSGARTLPAK